MNILVIGLGEVGRYLAATLSQEGHRVVAVDRAEAALELAEELADLQVLAGHGSALSTLKKAHAEQADLVVAVTDSDEVNMLAAMTAKQLGAREVIARVADRAYYSEAGGVEHNVVGIDLLINPQVLAAMEIHKVVRSLGVLEAENLADNRVEVVDLPVVERTRYLGRQLREIAMPKGFIIAAIVRGDRMLIPHGGETVEIGDRIWMIGDIDVIPKMAATFGMSRSGAAKRVVIVGGGEIGLEVALHLETDHVETIIIEKSLQRCRELSARLKDALVLHGDGTDRTLLLEEDVASADAFLAVTREDEVNIMACLLGKGLGVRRAVALIHRGDYMQAALNVGLDIAVSPRRSAARHILNHVRSEHVMRIYPVEDGKGEVLELLVPEGAPVLGRPLMYAEVPRHALITLVVRDKKVWVPRGTDEIRAGDVVLVFTLPEVRAQVQKLFCG